MTASAMVRMPWRAAQLHDALQVAVGRDRTPPEPMTGSKTKAATFSGLTRSNSAASASSESHATCDVSCTSGPNSSLYGMPRMLVPMPCVPW